MSVAPSPGLRWDIFCQVIDNYGDIGVCWRLARQLAASGHSVRVWLDDARALSWMAPQGCPNVTVLPWQAPLTLPVDLPPGDVLIEAFGCSVPDDFVQRYVDWRATDRRPAAWINLEYLSAEPYVERSHALPSPVMSGPGRGLTKHFFYPGFTARTGGLLREPDLMTRQQSFERTSWLQKTLGLDISHQAPLVSLFCYEPQALAELLAQLAQQQATLLVTPGRATAAVQACALPKGLNPHFLPWLTQDDYDHLLWACDLNFVRGEDSLVRALWAGQPFVWQIYPQQDQAHHAKLEALLDWMNAPPALRAAHTRWNGLDTQPFQFPELSHWGQAAKATRQGLLAQPDLLSQLLKFVATLG